MTTSFPPPAPQGVRRIPHTILQSGAGLLGRLRRGWTLAWTTVLAGLLLGTTPAQAHQNPPNCTGSALGINLFTDSTDVHIGESIRYSVTVFNGLPGSPRVACDATGIIAYVVTPDGLTNQITLRRTALVQSDADFYPNVVTYIVRAQDILPDGTVRATASDDGDIHQNDTDSRGGADQGLNSEVVQPCVQITATCTGSAGQFGAITFTGTVRNCGNAPLDNVTVTNQVNGGSFQILGPLTLAVGQSQPFNGSWVPLNPCAASTATFVVAGTDDLTITRTVTASTATTCQNTLTPAIRVTQACPAGPIHPGQLLTYTGTVTNTGNVTLTNVTVLGDHPANTVVYTVATLAPGAGSSFTGSYVAPVDCATASGVVASGTSVCGVPVSDRANITCAIVTTPLISVTTQCATNVVVPGGLQTYTGTVKNTGDIPLRNVVVTGDRPAANTTVFTVATLAPGASASFSGTYTVPLVNACAITATVVASGHDFCTDAAVTSTSAVTCGVTTAPQIAVTLACPAVSATVGGLVTYTGTVSNPGNVTLNNVTVVDTQSNPATVFTVATLAPGASANFTASFSAPLDACSVSTTVNASGSDSCTSKLVTASQSATCPLLTTPGLAITQNCPATPAVPGGLLTYTGTVRNSGNVTLTNVVVRNSLSGSTPVFTAATLAPGATGSFTGSYLAPTNCSSTSTAVATATSLCGVPATASATSTCTILTTPLISVSTLCSTNTAIPGGLQAYTGTVKNTGNIPLKNVVVTSDRPAANTTVFTVAILAPGDSAGFSGTYTVPLLNACALTTTVLATGHDNCTDVAVTSTSAVTCNVTTAPQIAVTIACPAVIASAGGPVTYTGTVSNPGNVTLNNVTVVDDLSTPRTVLTLASLAPGASTNFTVNFTTTPDTCSVSTTVIATGTDNCTSKLVTATQSATCPLLTLPGLALTQNCPASPTAADGLFTYTGTVRNTGNVTLTNVTVLDDRSIPAAVTTFWVDDQTPVGAVLAGDNGSFWNWVTGNPAPFSGSRAHQSNLQAGEHQDSFLSTNSSFQVNAGDILVAYVYLDPANPPAEVMLKWNDGTWEHRAFWGDDKLLAGLPGTAGHLHMGPLPATGQWVRLEVPASLVNLEGRALYGMAFTLFDGRATWDASGKLSTRATSATQVFTVATLAPGASAGFTGSYPLPAGGVCSVTTTLAASAADRCSGVNVTATSVQTCPIQTAPAIVVTHDCPATPVLPGGLLTYNGSVSNAGNITLTNIIVLGDRPGTNTVIFTAATLPPGASLGFTGSYHVPLNCCVVSSTLKASGQGCDGVTVNDTDTRTCTVLTLPQITVTKICTSPGLLHAGDLLTYSGTVSNAGNIVLINVRVVNDHAPGNPPVAGPLTLAPGDSFDYVASYIVPADFCGTDTVTASGQNVCTFLTVSDSVTTTCPVTTPPPRIAVTKDCPLVPTPRGGLYVYTGTVSNPGTVTLVDVFVVNDQPTNNTPILGPITLAPGQVVRFTNSFIAPKCCCLIVETLIARGQDRCSGVSVTAKTTTVCPLLSTPNLAIGRSSTSGTVPVGGLYTFHGSVTNTGDVVLTNVFVFSSQPGPRTTLLGPVELAPGESAAFTGSYVVQAGSNPATDTVTGQGTDTCQGRTVSASANNLGATGSVTPKITAITVVGDAVTVTWDATSGSTYSLQSKATVSDSWTNVPGDVTASGTSASKHDSVQTNTARLYRVIYSGQ